MSTRQKLGTSVAVTVSVSVTCLCWSLGHGEQLLFSCVSSKVSICNYVTCHLSHFTFHMLYVKCLCCFFGHAEQFLFSCLWSKVSIYICLCWSLGHAEQLLFSCLFAKVSICNYVTCHIPDVTLCLSLIHIWRCRRIERCRSRWSPYH